MMRSTAIRILSLLGLAIGLYACREAKAPEAEALLHEAQALGLTGAYADALALADSAERIAPANVDILREGTRIKREIRQREAEHKLIELDSLIRLKDEEAHEILPIFAKLKNEAYDTQLLYCMPMLLPNRLGARPHLRAMVDSLGVLQLVSVYTGGGKLNHSAIRLRHSAQDSAYTTPSVVHDDALNYRYNDGMNNWELVTYRAEVGDSLALYLQNALAQEGTFTIDFLSQGATKYRYKLPPAELSALRATIKLAKVLGDKQMLIREQTKYARRFARLDKKQ
ncbi:MAG: hypothetical protein Q4A64_04910 [Porphyromonadaceae bacterium]|nr:hypothetical protein [Porphyromonadaceae bacterium]